ncbi:MAG: hypothetical protein AW09_001518 [Candidatus Accumulibacter phosphatis]|uniref:DUF3999 domain-containing protein n=1 Tax=Candidatus Accumulibacter phosphatis TaxID=327160 RepID=A0A080LWR8_9PROT|nr:DUF3999 domain-containing protein [Accumulibacter sp.]KFB73227.1 MAG: hypothetical protein AW09_001518 [Candidatus Accumulibacter phosphatis]MBL8408238.1 DUF3999 domain-containing protein [Accumulibacter sp.]HRF12455.1 DUF3999 domain-containing protein [Candidatus Accumulibacter phosphatis]
MRIVLAWLLCLLNGVAIAETPEDFAFGMPLETRGAEALFQVELPQAVYEGVLRADLGDLRVFNASGEAVPHAFLPQPATSREKQQPLRLTFFALRGDAVVGVDALEVRIDRSSGRAVLTMNGRPPLRTATLLGYLIDATAIEQPLQALALELPRSVDNVVTRVRVDASDDLARWSTLVADAPVLRLEAGGQRLEQLLVEFPPRQAKFFRLSWPSAAPALQLAGLAGEPGETVVEAPRQWKQVAGSAVQEHSGEYVFDLGGRFPVDRLRLVLPQANSVASVEVLARTRASDPWRRITANTVYRLGVAGQEVVNPDLPIAPVSDRYWLLRVDPRGGGLGAGAPALAAGWLPQRLVFAARGALPFQLAYGSSTAAPAVYPIATLVPGYRAEDDSKARPFPIGHASTGSARTLAGERATRTPIDWKRWTLWGSLLLGVGLLGWMALRLSRQMFRAQPEQSRAGQGDR